MSKTYLNTKFLLGSLVRDVEMECTCCGFDLLSVFYESKGMPVNSEMLTHTRQEAIDCPKGEIELSFCRRCGFISNLVFDPKAEYSSYTYEGARDLSITCSDFSKNLARHLVSRYGLHNKKNMDIGFGSSDLLELLCESGWNIGTGFDPAFVQKGRKTGVSDSYSKHYSSYHGDLIICRLILEHMENGPGFLRTVRSSIGDRLDTVVFFQVPDVVRTLFDLAFWDICYEHCSYYSFGSIARLFRNSGFDILNVYRGFKGQHILLEAKPCKGFSSPALPQEDDIKKLLHGIEYFTENYRLKMALWDRRLNELKSTGYRVIIWGASSKSVSFLMTLKISDWIKYVVDINPCKYGTFVAGTGQEIVSPLFLKEYRPDAVIIMDSVYLSEIGHDLKKMGLFPELLLV